MQYVLLVNIFHTPQGFFWCILDYGKWTHSQWEMVEKIPNSDEKIPNGTDTNDKYIIILSKHS